MDKNKWVVLTNTFDGHTIYNKDTIHILLNAIKIIVKGICINDLEQKLKEMELGKVKIFGPFYILKFEDHESR